MTLRDDCRVSRDAILQSLLDAGIAAKRGVMTAHREPCYVEAYGPQSLPISEKASDRSLLLPLFPAMTEAEQDQVVAKLVPAKPAATPDFLARAKAIWGDSPTGKPLSELVMETRGGGS